jgi:hypothetical protein
MDITPAYIKKAKSPYWEAFRIAPDATVSEKDTWYLQPFKSGKDVVKAEWTATATYYDDMTLVQLMGKGFTLDNKETLAGEKVYATAKNPNLGQGSTNSLTRAMRLKYNGPNKEDSKTHVNIKAKDYGYDNKDFVSKF